MVHQFRVTRSVTPRSLIVSSILLGGMAVGPVIASAGDDPVADTLSEVVVTARYRAERAQDIPDTVAVLDNQYLERNSVTTLKDVTLLLPNVGISESLSPGSSFINIRGLNTIRNGDPAVAIILDGVQFTNVNEVSQDLNDIAQIEVLKGPQGALYGRNAIGGAINITTRAPSKTQEGQFEVGAGNGRTEQARGSVSGPVTDELFYRLSGSFSDSGGFIYNPVEDRNTDFTRNYNVRARLRWEPNDALSVDGRVSWDGLKAGTYYYEPVVNSAGVPIFNQASNFNFAPTSDPISVDYRNVIDASVRADWKLPTFVLTAIGAHNRTTEHYGRAEESIGEAIPGDLDWTPDPILANSQTWSFNTSTFELRASSSNTTGLKWTGGLYYFNQDRRIALPVSIAFGNYGIAINNLTATLNGVPTPLDQGMDPSDPLTAVPSQNDETKTSAYAAFFNFSYSLTSVLEATVGGRYDNNLIKQQDFSFDAQRSVRYDSFQPKFSLNYKFDDEHNVYATASKGFRSGGFNSVINTVTTFFKPETLWNYEIGSKNSLFDKSIQLNVAAFYEDYKNSQQFQFDGATATQTIFNIEKSRIYGAEADAAWRTPVQGLALQASIGLMKSKIQAVGGLPAAVVKVVGDPVGNYLPIIDHWTFTMGGQYSHPINANWTLTPSADLTGRGKQFWYIDNANEAPPLFLLNAAINLDGYNHWRIGFNIENALDKHWYSSYESQRQTTLFTDVAWPQVGRKYMGTVRYTF